jgi:integrase/recombinase XerD
MSFSINLELNNKCGTDGRSRIMLRLTRNRKSSRLITNISVSPGNFNLKAKFGKWIRTGEPYHAKYNSSLVASYNELQFFSEALLSDSHNTSAKDIIAKYKEQKNASQLPSSWINYFDRLIIHFKSIKKERYAIRMQAIRNKLKNFLGDTSLDLKDTTVELANQFEAYLYSLGNAPNTTAGNLKVLKQVYRKAIDDQIVNSPNMQFLKHTVKTEHVERDKLTAEEIVALEEVELPEFSLLWNVRNYFLFAFYMGGIRFGDFVELRWKNIVDGNLRYLMNKTGKQQRLVIHTKARAILDLYQGTMTSKEAFVFPLLPKSYFELDRLRQIRISGAKNALVNKYLKEVATKAEIKKNLSFHTARHSFAYIAFKKTKDPLAVQHALQHSKLKETQEYITSLANDSERDILGEIFN